MIIEWHSNNNENENFDVWSELLNVTGALDPPANSKLPRLSSVFSFHFRHFRCCRWICSYILCQYVLERLQWLLLRSAHLLSSDYAHIMKVVCTRFICSSVCRKFDMTAMFSLLSPRLTLCVILWMIWRRVVFGVLGPCLTLFSFPLQMVWQGGRVLGAGDGPAGAVPGGPVQLLLAAVHSEDGAHAGWPNGGEGRVHPQQKLHPPWHQAGQLPHGHWQTLQQGQLGRRMQNVLSYMSYIVDRDRN